MILTLALWAALVLCALLAAAGFTAIARTRGWGDAARWDGPLLFTAVTVILLTVLGVIRPLPGAFLALAPLALVTLTMVPSWRALAARDGKGAATRRVAAGLFGHVRDSALNARDDARGLRNRKGNQAPAGPGPQRPAAPAAPAAAGGTAPARETPPLREDPALGPAPAPAQIAERVTEGTVVVPGPWAELSSWIAGYQPEDDNDQSMFIHGNAAGLVAVMEALGAHAETVVSEIGLDPSYGLAVLEFADAIAQAAGLGALTDARYHVIYGEIKQAIENGLVIPHKARQWFGGGAGPQDGPSESAA